MLHHLFFLCTCNDHCQVETATSLVESHILMPNRLRKFQHYLSKNPAKTSYGEISQAITNWRFMKHRAHLGLSGLTILVGLGRVDRCDRL